MRDRSYVSTPSIAFCAERAFASRFLTRWLYAEWRGGKGGSTVAHPVVSKHAPSQSVPVRPSALKKGKQVREATFTSVVLRSYREWQYRPNPSTAFGQSIPSGGIDHLSSSSALNGAICVFILSSFEFFALHLGNEWRARDRSPIGSLYSSIDDDRISVCWLRDL